MLSDAVGKRSTPERILLVDDSLVGLRVRKVVLEELGVAVTTVCCGLDALQCFIAQHFDLVITDYQMPNMDGIALIARIREHSPSTPIILISGFAEALGLTESNTGADIVIQKSCHEVSTLTRGVTRLLTRRTPKKPVRSQTTTGRHAVAIAR